MHIYLPIAEISVNLFAILMMGSAVGFLSGMFGIGGGFLMTPLLLFTGISPTIAVATVANQIMATSFSAALAQFKRANVDVKLGLVLLSGGIVGSFIGVKMVTWLKKIGQIDFFISSIYVTFLGIIGLLMLVESLNTMRRASSDFTDTPLRKTDESWLEKLPLKQRFKTSKIHISIIPPIILGCLVGILAAIMGVGGGFILVPGMIYLLRVPTNIAVGTSLFQTVFVTGLVTILHSVSNQSVDAILAILLMIGGVIGAQFGVRAGLKLKGEHLRGLLALLVLAVCLKMGYDLISQPDELFSLNWGKSS